MRKLCSIFALSVVAGFLSVTCVLAQIDPELKSYEWPEIGGNGDVRKADTIVAMKAVPDLVDGDQVTTAGAYIVNDGRGRLYRYYSTPQTDEFFPASVNTLANTVAPFNQPDEWAIGDKVVLRWTTQPTSDPQVRTDRLYYVNGVPTAGQYTLSETSPGGATINFSTAGTGVEVGLADDGLDVLATTDDQGGFLSTQSGSLTSKGDLHAFDGVKRRRLPVGDDGALLEADSAARLGVAWKQKQERWFASVADAVSATNLVAGQIVHTAHYDVPNDSGGNAYTFLSSQDLPPDGGFVINVTAGGQLVANDQTIANVRQFGAKGDGVADDAPALRAAYTSAIATGATVLIPSGIYNQGSTINANTGPLKIRGSNAVIRATSVGVNGWSNSLADIDIEGVTFDGGDVADLAWIIVCTPASHSRLRNCDFRNIRHDNVPANRSAAALRIGASTPDEITVKSCGFEQLRAIGNDIKGDAAGSIRGISSASNAQLLQVEDCVFRDVHTLNSDGTTIQWEDADAIEITPAVAQQAVVINNCRFDKSGKRAARINNTYLTQVSDCTYTGLVDDSPRAMIECVEGRLEVDNCRQDGSASQFFVVIANKGSLASTSADAVINNCQHAPTYSAQVRDVNTAFLQYENARSVAVTDCRSQDTEVGFNAHPANTNNPDLSLENSVFLTNLKLFDDGATPNLAGPLSVKATGAVGDGTTDDTAAIAAAAAGATALNGSVYLPNGSYLNNGVVLVSNGSEAHAERQEDTTPDVTGLTKVYVSTSAGLEVTGLDGHAHEGKKVSIFIDSLGVTVKHSPTFVLDMGTDFAPPFSGKIVMEYSALKGAYYEVARVVYP